jgi:hypothetical protein
VEHASTYHRSFRETGVALGRHFTAREKCREDPNPDRRLRLRPGGNCSQAPRAGIESLPNFYRFKLTLFVKLTLFEKTPISQAIPPPDSQDDLFDPANQLNLFGL